MYTLTHRVGMAIAVTVAMAPSLIFLLLLLLLPLFSATVSSAAITPNPKTVKFMARDVRASIKESAKDHMEHNAQQDVPSRSGYRKDGSGAALVFDLSVGTSPQTLPVVMDVTSDLVWAQCVPCPTCTRLTLPETPTFLPNNSDSADKVLCASKTCRRMIPGGRGYGQDGDLCWYDEDLYGSGNTSGFLVTDTFSFDTKSVPDVVFGCSLDIMVPDLVGASGYAGVSRGARSLVSQLGISSFTYFIAPLGDPAAKSFVSWSLGADADLDTAVQTSTGGSTPLQKATENQNPDLYYVKLTGVQVDGQLLTAIPAETFDVRADGSGGVFLSTIQPVTYLEEAAYRVLRRELVSRAQSNGMAPVNVDGDVRHLCFLAKDFTNARVPRLSLVFDGADAVMELKVENYFLAVNSGQTCLTILPSKSGSVLGSLLQAGRNMTYDIHGGQLTFQTAAAIGPAAAAGAPEPEPVPLMIMATLLVLWLGQSQRSLF